MSEASVALDHKEQQLRLVCQGAFTLQSFNHLAQQFSQLIGHSSEKSAIVIDGKEITSLDSAGAALLERWHKQLADRGIEVNFNGFADKQQHLLDLVLSAQSAQQRPACSAQKANLLARLGKKTVTKIQNANALLNFLGVLVVGLMDSFRQPSRIQWRAQIAEIEASGYRALPIVGLLAFLIGVVLTYQMGLQLKAYGANIYIVNLSGMAVLREFGPLITAIIVAGRTSSAFAAQIGTMHVNEEVDALRTMGLSPTDYLVLPKIIGLLLALPLLTFWADCFGVFGSMVMANGMLGINYYDFILRFREAINLETYLIGISKAPVFAAIIAVVGCFQGFQVKGSADSVGRQTTSAVVQAIFLIIIADAIFSVVFSIQGI